MTECFHSFKIMKCIKNKHDHIVGQNDMQTFFFSANIKYSASKCHQLDSNMILLIIESSLLAFVHLDMQIYWQNPLSINVNLIMLLIKAPNPKPLPSVSVRKYFSRHFPLLKSPQARSEVSAMLLLNNVGIQ